MTEQDTTTESEPTPKLRTPLKVTEDVQERVGPESYVVYEAATGPGLVNDLVQRGIFWHEEHAELFAASPDLRDALVVVLKEHDDDLRGDVKRKVHHALRTAGVDPDA